VRLAFFHDHRFRRDSTGTYFSTGGLSYQVFKRYLKHFDSVVVVARLQSANAEDFAALTVASGAGVTMQCVERSSPVSLAFGSRERRQVRDVLARADCAIVRLPSQLGLVACSEASRIGTPLMIEIAGCAFDSAWHHGSRAARLAAPGVYWLTRRAVSKSAFAVYVSDSYLQQRYPCRGTTVACSNVVIGVPEAEVLERRIARITTPGGAGASIGLVGSLDVDYKGHDTALLAFRRVRRRDPRARLKFLGQGDPTRWRERARALGLDSHVEFVGTLPAGPQVLTWMDGLDMLWVPSLTEGLPRALVEAMSRGVPCVGSRVGGIPELLGQGVTHPPRDHRALAALSTRLIGDSAELVECARRNFAVAQSYAAPVLEARRERCLRQFADYAAARRLNAVRLTMS
jgi:hypothetical protein